MALIKIFIFRAVGATTAALFFPVIPWILQLGVIAYVLAVAVYISTVGNPLYEVRDFSSNECNTAACNNNTVQVIEHFLFNE